LSKSNFKWPKFREGHNTDLIFNLKTNLEVLEKQLGRTHQTTQTTKLVKSTKISLRDGDIVKGKVYCRKDDLGRNTTEKLVRDYYSKRYTTKKTEIFELLKVRCIRLEKRKIKDEACKRRISMINELIKDRVLYGA